MGFFTKGELSKTAVVKVDTDQLIPDCLACGLYKKSETPKMKISGKGKERILIIGESSTLDEDMYGTPFVCEDGDVLKDELNKQGISLNRDCWRMNAVACKVVGEINHKYINCCKNKVERAIRELKPKLVFLLGPIAVTSVLGSEFSDRTINRWRAYRIPDEKHKCFLFPTFHPSFINYKLHDKNLRSTFNRDIKRGINTLNLKYTGGVDYEKKVTVLKDFKKVKSLLKRILKRKAKIAFDYEATGLKPYREGHKIVTIGVAVSATKAYAFPFDFNSFWTKKELKDIKILWKRILLDKKIKKIAHNMKFEDLWSKVRGGAKPKGWYWDTLTAEHILDNRRKSLKLKFLTFVKFGVRPYDKTIDHFLKTIKGGKGDINIIEKAPLNELLIYNGLDCIFTWMLYEEQKKRLSNRDGLARAFGFWMKGTLTMATVSENGIYTDMPYYKQAKKSLTKRIDKLKQYLISGREAKKFKKHFGRDIKITSNKDLGKLFYEVLGRTPVYTNEKKDNYKTDKITLEELKLPFVDKLAEMKKLEKARGTYLAQFARESYKGVMHPFFDLHIPVSYRSSSSLPNFQNVPKRDKEIKIIVRKGLVPPKDFYFCEADFSGAEVITSVSYHKDENFYNYLIDPSTDMHRDCYDTKTKILTQSGFKFYHEIGDDEKIGQYNPDTNKIEFVSFTNRIYHDYNGPMYRIKNKHFDTCTTEKHRMYLRKKDKDYSIIEAKDIKQTRYYSKIVAEVDKVVNCPEFNFDAVYGTGTNRNKKYHDGFLIKQNDMFELLGYLITDGHFKKSKQGSYRINLSQIKEPHKSKMKKCIDRIKSYTNFQFHEEFDQDKWSMSNKNLCSWLCENFGINKINRKLPDFIKYAPIDKLKIFFEACMVGDGSWYPSGTSGKFHLISKQLIEDFQFICMRLGYASSLYKYELKGNRTTQVYCINIRKMEESLLVIRDQLSINKYSGKVFCFTVPSGILVTQRNNKMSIQGNCATDLFMLKDGMLANKDFTDDQKSKAGMVRFFAKNGWTFAQFYGDWYKSCGETLWESCVESNLELPNGKTVKEWLAMNGIYELGEVDKSGPTHGSFLEHCKEVEDKMWNERFPEYTQWKKDIVKFYQKYGFIETFLGFRFIGYMDNKQCCNFPIQGCLQGHSKVLTSKGWKRIDSLIDKKVKVWTGFEWKKAVGINRGKCKTATVHLESGLQLDCDIRHEFKNEDNKWIKFKDLKVGDYVALPKLSDRVKNPKINIDWPFILGFMTGDGWFGSKELSKNNTRFVLQISGGHSKYDILQAICNFFSKYTGDGFPKPTVKNPKKNTFVLHAEGKKMAELIMSFGYECNKTAHTKSIPNSVWNGTRKQQQSFMDGLWLSDGSRKRKSLHLCNKSLLKEVQVLLYGLGYDSFIRKTNDGYKLTPQNVIHGTFTSRTYPRKTFSMLWEDSKLETKPRNEYIVNKRNINSDKDMGQKVAERILSQKEKFVELYRYDKVIGIDVSEKTEDTYTMSVDDELHQFVADGIICKNTSFHLLVYTMIQVQKFIVKHKLRTRICGQIHDSIISYIHKDEVTFYLNGMNKIVTELKDRFDWLMVPMEMEYELSKLSQEGGNFSKLKEYSINEINDGRFM
jgi:uracil-DNA glycosylase family 4